MSSRMKGKGFPFKQRLFRVDTPESIKRWDHQSIMLQTENALINLQNEKKREDICTKYELGYASLRGARSENEDRFTAHYCSDGNFFVFCLFDGHEGEGMADYLTKYLPQYISTPCKDLYSTIKTDSEFQITTKSPSHQSTYSRNSKETSVQRNLMAVFSDPFGSGSEDDEEDEKEQSQKEDKQIYSDLTDRMDSEGEDKPDGWKSSLCYYWVSLDDRWKVAEQNKSLRKRDDSGSTASCIVFSPGKNPMLALSVGDSSVIGYTREGEEKVLCELHKPSKLSEKNRIRRAGGTIVQAKKGTGNPVRVSIPGTYNFGLAVSRAFGDICYKKGSPMGYKKDSPKLQTDIISAVPDIQAYEINAFELIVMASDGLWDVMRPQKVYEFVKQKIDVRGTDTKPDMITICKQLVRKAVYLGSKDNVTVIILYFPYQDDPNYDTGTVNDSRMSMTPPSKMSRSSFTAITMHPEIVGQTGLTPSESVSPLVVPRSSPNSTTMRTVPSIPPLLDPSNNSLLPPLDISPFGNKKYSTIRENINEDS